MWPAKAWTCAVLALVVGCFAGVAAQKGKSDAVVPLRTHSIYAPYVDSNLQNRYFDFGGDAIVDTNRHIRLTQDKPSQMGWLWSRLVLTPPNFEIVVEFKIDGKSSSLHGDGMAMWLTKERARPGPVFGSIDGFTGLGIFFDTYPNSRHSYSFPRIMAMMGDGHASYDGGKDGAKNEIGACSLDIRRAKVATKARLTYLKGTSLSLDIHYKDWDQWDNCFTIYNITIPTNPFLGFSAITGDVSDAHDVVSVTTSNIVYRAKTTSELREEAARAAARGRSSESGSVMGSFFSFIFTLIKWVFILAIVGLAFVAFRTWQRNKNLKRF